MDEDFQYDRINDGIKIFKYIGTAENVIIPEISIGQGQNSNF